MEAVERERQRAAEADAAEARKEEEGALLCWFHFQENYCSSGERCRFRHARSSSSRGRQQYEQHEQHEQQQQQQQQQYRQQYRQQYQQPQQDAPEYCCRWRRR